MAEIIGISGYAGCGKDLFFNLFKEELSKRGATAERVAIADPLKLEVRDTLLQLKGIDPMNCSRTQKDEIRDGKIANEVDPRLSGQEIGRAHV